MQKYSIILIKVTRLGSLNIIKLLTNIWINSWFCSIEEDENQTKPYFHHLCN